MSMVAARMIEQQKQTMSMVAARMIKQQKQTMSIKTNEVSTASR